MTSHLHGISLSDPDLPFFFPQSSEFVLRIDNHNPILVDAIETMSYPDGTSQLSVGFGAHRNMGVDIDYCFPDEESIASAVAQFLLDNPVFFDILEYSDSQDVTPEEYHCAVDTLDELLDVYVALVDYTNMDAAIEFPTALVDDVFSSEEFPASGAESPLVITNGKRSILYSNFPSAKDVFE